MNVLGLKIKKHDTGAALISGGRIVAIAEERLNRVKHSRDMFPKLAISYCLDALRIKPEEVDLVVIDQTDLHSVARMKEFFLSQTGGLFARADIRVMNHHDAHASSAFFASPFADAAILVYDGAGEKFKTHLGVLAVETDTLYHGSGNRFVELQKTVHLRGAKEFPYTFGVGKLYAFLSQFYIGFGPYNEGKMMGLAPYGDDSLLKAIPPEQWFCERNGHILCNARISFPHRSVAERLGRGADFAALWRRFQNKMRMRWASFLKHLLRALQRRYDKERFAEPDFFAPIALPYPPRGDSAVALPDRYYSSVAYAGQKILEQVAVAWGRRLKQITGSKNLCVAGGVGLNIDANKKFLDEVGFDHIFVQPGASDTGIPLGCALYGYHVILNQPRHYIMESASLGRPYGEEEILQAIERRHDKISAIREPDIATTVARLLADGNIVGWFYGGSEYGPRALGHRSILCDARRADMKDILNIKVKRRESWRPFAASVLREYMSDYFEITEESPFMLLAASVRDEKRKQVPAVVHVDGTCRIQSVTGKANGRYYNLIAAFHRITGVPLVLNTSFNLGGDPIIETPTDAIECFLKTKMDYLVLEEYLVSKKAADF